MTVTEPTNSPPDGNDDSATTQENTPVTINVLANDSDPNGDLLTVTGVSDPPNGSAANNGDGTVAYTPDTGLVGIDTFTYTISDGRGGSDAATVTVMVNPGLGVSGKVTGAGADRFSIRIVDLMGAVLHQADSLLGGGNIEVQ